MEGNTTTTTTTTTTTASTTFTTTTTTTTKHTTDPVSLSESVLTLALMALCVIERGWLNHFAPYDTLVCPKL